MAFNRAEVRHGWVITSHWKLWMWSIIQVLISVCKRGHRLQSIPFPTISSYGMRIPIIWYPFSLNACLWGNNTSRGGLPLWESVGMRHGFAPHFRHLDDLFAPQNLTMTTILFRSCWIPFRSPTFSACRRSFCPPNWPNLSYYSDLVGSRFELRAAHPYWFWPGVPPPPPRATHAKKLP